MMYELGTRKQVKRYVKITTISKERIDEKIRYSFYSASDECKYSYVGYSLGFAIASYEIDTNWQGFAEIKYYTDDIEIKKEFEEMSPF